MCPLNLLITNCSEPNTCGHYKRIMISYNRKYTELSPMCIANFKIVENKYYISEYWFLFGGENV